MTHGATQEAKVALVGYGPDAARALRELGLQAVTVPGSPLEEVLPALRTLRFSGALFAPQVEQAALAHVRAEGQARRAGAVDVVSIGAEVHGTHTLEDALVRLLEDSRYASFGSKLLLLGEGARLRAAAGLARLGAASVTVAARSTPEAEGVVQLLPGGGRGYAVSLTDSALPGLAERVDLVVLASGSLPRGVLQPYHTLLDLTGGAVSAAERSGVQVIDASDLGAWRLSLQLEHATHQRFKPEVLRGVADVLA